MRVPGTRQGGDLVLLAIILFLFCFILYAPLACQILRYSTSLGAGADEAVLLKIMKSFGMLQNKLTQVPIYSQVNATGFELMGLFHHLD